MMFRTTTAEAVKRSILPLAFFQAALPAFTPRRTTGWLDGGLCPFHDDRRPGSFKVNLDSGAFRCFSCGASGGSVLDFMMKRDGLDFRTALRVVAENFGVSR